MVYPAPPRREPPTPTEVLLDTYDWDYYDDFDYDYPYAEPNFSMCMRSGLPKLRERVCTSGADCEDNSKDESTNVEENSSGFHMIEIHMPTVGTGVTIIFMLLVAAAIAWLTLKWCRARKRRLRQAEAGFALDPIVAPRRYDYDSVPARAYSQPMAAAPIIVQAPAPAAPSAPRSRQSEREEAYRKMLALTNEN